MKKLPDLTAVVRGTFAHDGAFKAISKARDGMYVSLVREPFNQYDRNAVRVDLGKVPIGHIPRGYAKWLAPRMDAGARFVATVDSTFCGDNGSFCRCTLNISQLDEYEVAPKAAADESESVNSIFSVLIWVFLGIAAILFFW